MKQMTLAEITEDMDLEIKGTAVPLLQRWLDRGDGVAWYQNANLESNRRGHSKWVSFGSPTAQIEADEPPVRMPDVGEEINWAYQLVGTCKA